MIASYLPYPDLLALTLTHPIFRSHSLVRTTKSSRVDWLLDRAMLGLPLPTQSRCRWSSDNEFVSHPEVITIMRKRRQHVECAEMSSQINGKGSCFVVEGEACPRLMLGARGEEILSQCGSQGNSDELLAALLRARASIEFTTKVRKAGLKLIYSWQGALVAILIAAALWFVV